MNELSQHECWDIYIYRSMKIKRTVVIRISSEEMAEDLSVGGSVAGPHVPYFVAHRVGHKFILRPFHDIVRTHVGWLSVGVFRSIQGLCREQAEMLSPEQAAKGGSMVTGLERLSVHDAVHEIVIFHHDRQFAVV